MFSRKLFLTNIKFEYQDVVVYEMDAKNSLSNTLR